MTCILGIDIGTSSTKVSAFTREGTILASAQQGYSMIQPEPGFAEQDPDVLLEAVRDCISQVILAVGSQARIAAFSFSAAMHGIMALDKDGFPLTRIITWADTRSQAESADIRQSADASSIYATTGVPIHPMSPLCKLRWLHKYRPDITDRAAMFAGIKEYVIHKLTGQWVMDYSIASATGLFDITRLDWYPPALSWAGIRREQLPIPVNPLQKLSLNHTTPFQNPASEIMLIPGASDGCLANLGSGAMEPGLLALTIGTSGAVRMTVNEPKPDPGGRTFNYVLLPGTFVTGGPVNNGGIILKWFAEQILGKPFGQAGEFKWFLDEASKIPPGAGGLTCLPWFMGERAPIWNAAATGIFHGMTLRHSRTHMMRALVEGICFSLYSIAEILEHCAGPIDKIMASGGFTASNQWIQMIADIFNKPVQVAQDTDASATGAAMLGFIATGEANGWEDFRSWMGSRQSFTPESGAVALYHEAYQRFNELATTYGMNK